jgi:hypothetical protein
MLGGDRFRVAPIARSVSVWVWRKGAAGAGGMVLEQPVRCQVPERGSTLLVVLVA